MNRKSRISTLYESSGRKSVLLDEMTFTNNLTGIIESAPATALAINIALQSQIESSTAPANCAIPSDKTKQIESQLNARGSCSAL
ncbi:hypothetical protein AO065_18175 [Pseudomonas viridiflava]|nr:hypothetical protein AO065_18175 [Pseudomonas viridiflava]